MKPLSEMSRPGPQCKCGSRWVGRGAATAGLSKALGGLPEAEGPETQWLDFRQIPLCLSLSDLTG